METKVMKHNCKHEGQDKIYGKSMRLWNEAKSRFKDGKAYTCTVCGEKVEM